MEMMRKEMLVQQTMEMVNEDEGFFAALIGAEDAATVKKVLDEKGVEVSLEEVETLFRDGAQTILEHKDALESGELSLDQLDDVSGGGWGRYLVRGTISVAAGYGYGVFCAFCPTAYAFAPKVAVGLAAWSAAGYFKKGW